jgi:hypothetical protein
MQEMRESPEWQILIYLTQPNSVARCGSSDGCERISYEIKKEILPSLNPISRVHETIKGQLCLLRKSIVFFSIFSCPGSIIGSVQSLIESILASTSVTLSQEDNTTIAEQQNKF